MVGGHDAGLETIHSPSGTTLVGLVASFSRGYGEPIEDFRVSRFPSPQATGRSVCGQPLTPILAYQELTTLAGMSQMLGIEGEGFLDLSGGLDEFEEDDDYEDEENEEDEDDG